MKLFSIVIHFNIFEHLVFGFRTVLEAFAVHRVDLEAVVPTFHGGIAIVFVKQTFSRGSGKSILLRTLVGEINRIQTIPNGRKTPKHVITRKIMAITLRKNITHRMAITTKHTLHIRPFVVFVR
jgi:hypothetical protein